MSEILDQLSIDTSEEVEAALADRRPLLSVVVPTRNEAMNVDPLVSALDAVLEGIDAEIVFVDDSDDDTPTRVRHAAADGRGTPVRLVQRVGEQRSGGLSGAVLDGIAASHARWVCVMDGDLQHPPATIVRMLELAQRGDVDLVVASRHQPSGSDAGLSGVTRKALSTLSGWAAHVAFPDRLREVSDPMSGFFLVDRTKVDTSRVRPRGFKILLELAVSHPELRVAEVPFEFAPRHSGDSKASVRQGFEFARQLVELKRRESDEPSAHWYDIHGILSVQSERALPELEKFLVDELPGPADIVVVVGQLDDLPIGEAIDATGDVPRLSYRERTGFGMALTLSPARIDITVTPFVARSPHVMYTNVVEPVLRWRIAETGHALVHAACFSDGDRAFLVTARTDTGKTTTMLKVLDDTPFQFISDDLVIVSPDGVIRSLPKPLTISAHTVHALRDTTLTRFERLVLVPQSRVHSREGRRFAFLLTKYRLPVASINTLIQRIVPPPKYHVERLVRGVEVADRSQLTSMFVIERGGAGDEALSAADALSTLLANCDDAFGFPPYESLERLMLAVADDDLRLVEREIIASALDTIPAQVMRSEHLDWAERIRAIVVESADEFERVDAAAGS